MAPPLPETNDTVPVAGSKLKLVIGTTVFTATLTDNQTARAFSTLLPLTIDMADLNSNEKFAQLPGALPVNATVPSGIRSGDLMLYGSGTLVLFYKSFTTSYSYTKIGQIDNVNGLQAALGSGNATVRIEALM